MQTRASPKVYKMQTNLVCQSCRQGLSAVDKCCLSWNWRCKSEKCRKCTRDAKASVIPCAGLCKVCLQQCGNHAKGTCVYTLNPSNSDICYEARELCCMCQDPACVSLPGRCNRRKDIRVEMARSAKPLFKLIRSAQYLDQQTGVWR